MNLVYAVKFHQKRKIYESPLKVSLTHFFGVLPVLSTLALTWFPLLNARTFLVT